MAQLGAMNPDVKAGMGGSSLLPAGKYRATVIKTEVGPTYQNDGKQVLAYFDVEGSEIRLYMTVQGGAEPWMADSGQKQLRLLSECTGNKWPITDTDVLCGREVMVKLEQKESKKLKDDGTPFVNNVIKNIMPAEPKEAVGGTIKAPW